jgi:uroporphyrinogen III methyltransferase / synthase
VLRPICSGAEQRRSWRAWAEVKPLSGLRIVVTRASHQAGELADPLRALGADVLLVPMIGIAPPADPAPLREAAGRHEGYDWIIFGSVNAVTAFADNLPSPPVCRANIAAVGPATSEAAERLGFHVRVVPEKYVAESLVEAVGSEDLNGKHILIPAAAVTRDVIPGALKKLGAQVEVVEAYRNVIPPEAPQRAAQVFRTPLPDWITFASSSAVENAISLVGAARIAQMRIATIGPVTSASARKHGLKGIVEADPHTIEGLVGAIVRHAH